RGERSKLLVFGLVSGLVWGMGGWLIWGMGGWMVVKMSGGRSAGLAIALFGGLGGVSNVLAYMLGTIWKQPLATVRTVSAIESYRTAKRLFTGGPTEPFLQLVMTELIWKLRLQRVRFIPLLETAVDRQVLRRAGAVYQFRHAALQDLIATLTIVDPIVA